MGNAVPRRASALRVKLAEIFRSARQDDTRAGGLNTKHVDGLLPKRLFFVCNQREALLKMIRRKARNVSG